MNNPRELWVPLRRPEFRVLWLAWLASNLCMWIHESGTGWLMMSFTSDPLLVALVQSAATAPVFLLALPSGALVDVVDRRRFLIFTQLWSAGLGLGAAGLAATGLLTPAALLVASTGMGIALAMRLPGFAALTQDVVARDELAPAILLNGIGQNLSRAVGPLAAGAILAVSAAGYVFLVNGILSLAAAMVLLSWKHESPSKSALPSERFFAAIRLGLQFARQSPAMHAVLIRGAVFFFFACAPLVLLPLIARDRLGGGPLTYGLLLGCLGVGAIVFALSVQQLRKRMSRDQLAMAGTLLLAAATLAVAWSPHRAIVGVAMLVAGFSWMGVGAALQVAAQQALPDWVRGRALAVTQMAYMGGMAAGAAAWGKIASLTDVSSSLTIASAAAVLALGATVRLRLGGRIEEDLTPSRHWSEPSVVIPIEEDRGPVLVTIEYLIDASRIAEFTRVMQDSRRFKLRHGAIAWALFQDAEQPGRFVEHFAEASWIELLRHRDRVTKIEQDIRDRKRQFHIGSEPPALRYFIAEEIPARRRSPPSR